jgi:hypothetical protein
MIQIHDDIFDKIFLLELSHWLLKDCNWNADNVARRHSYPYGIEGESRFLGTLIYENFEGTEEKYWECIYENPTNNFRLLCDMYKNIQKHSKNKCMLQRIDGNLQFKDMDGVLHRDGFENQTVFIMMLAYHDIEENMGGEFYHEPSGEKIPFKQGRIMEMTASDFHRADAFNVQYIPRFSIKFTGRNDGKSQIYDGKNISF